MEEMLCPQFYITSVTKSGHHHLIVTFKAPHIFRLRDYVTDTNGITGYVVKIDNPESITIGSFNDESFPLKCNEHFLPNTHVSLGVFAIKPEFLYKYVNLVRSPKYTQK